MSLNNVSPASCLWIESPIKFFTNVTTSHKMLFFIKSYESVQTKKASHQIYSHTGWSLLQRSELGSRKPYEKKSSRKVTISFNYKRFFKNYCYISETFFWRKIQENCVLVDL